MEFGISSGLGFVTRQVLPVGNASGVIAKQFLKTSDKFFLALYCHPLFSGAIEALVYDSPLQAIGYGETF